MNLCPTTKQDVRLMLRGKSVFLWPLPTWKPIKISCMSVGPYLTVQRHVHFRRFACLLNVMVMIKCMSDIVFRSYGIHNFVPFDVRPVRTWSLENTLFSFWFAGGCRWHVTKMHSVSPFFRTLHNIWLGSRHGFMIWGFCRFMLGRCKVQLLSSWKGELSSEGTFFRVAEVTGSV